MDRFTLRRYLRDVGWVGGGIGLALGIDYLFYVFTGKLLGPEEFGIFGAVLAVYYVLVGAPFQVLEMVSKRMEADGQDAIARLSRPALKAGVVVWAAVLLLADVLAPLLDIPAPLLRLFAFTFPVAYVVPVLIGRVHGRERFRTYALYEGVTSIARFSGVGLILLGFGVFGAVAGPILELVVGVVLLYVLLRPLSGSVAFQAWGVLARSAVFIVSVYAAFSVDILLLNIFYPSTLVGHYTAVAVLGKALFFGSVAVNRAVFPKFVKENNQRRTLIRTGSILIGGTGIVAIAFFSVFGEAFLRLAFGAAYETAAGFAPLYMVFITLVSLLTLLGNYYLATDDRRIWLFSLLPLLQTAGIVLFHASVQQVIFAGIGAASTTALLLYIVPIVTSRTAGAP